MYLRKINRHVRILIYIVNLINVELKRINTQYEFDQGNCERDKYCHYYIGCPYPHTLLTTAGTGTLTGPQETTAGTGTLTGPQGTTAGTGTFTGPQDITAGTGTLTGS